MHAQAQRRFPLLICTLLLTLGKLTGAQTTINQTFTTTNPDTAMLLCKEQQALCQKYASEPNIAKARIHCMNCHDRCNVRPISDPGEARAIVPRCMRPCARIKCFNNGNIMSLTPYGACRYLEEICKNQAQRDDQNPNNLCTKCIDTCTRVFKKAADSCKVIQQCRKEESQCEANSKVGNKEKMRIHCQNCHDRCGSKPIGNEPKVKRIINKCLNLCASRKCFESADIKFLTPDSACKYFDDVCRMDNENKDPNSETSCTICSQKCEGISNETSAWCRPVSSTAPNVSDNSPVPVPNPSSKTKEANLWDWLGPVLGSTATIVGAIITVVWMRDRQHRRRSRVNEEDCTDPDAQTAVQPPPYESAEQPHEWPYLGKPPSTTVPAEYGSRF